MVSEVAMLSPRNMQNAEISPHIKPGAGRLGKRHHVLVIFDTYFLVKNLPAPHLAHPKIVKFEHWGREISQSRLGGGNAEKWRTLE
jgi:hypothetical protein